MALDKGAGTFGTCFRSFGVGAPGVVAGTGKGVGGDSTFAISFRSAGLLTSSFLLLDSQKTKAIITKVRTVVPVALSG